MLDHAARLAIRGMGDVEPNPMVGCIIGRDDGTILGSGHHRRFGGPHAEIDALQACGRRGTDPRGATAWVTLEPCSHTGKTPPCSQALIDAGISRVVIARRDPGAHSGGGLEDLRDAGIDVEQTTVSAAATHVSDPFVHRVRTGLPWVIAKWAQTIDGRIATSAGESKWITNNISRRHVHRLRGCVDVILTDMGTVRADDPCLTARAVPVRRIARRAVIDPRLELPLDSALMRSTRTAPVSIYAAAGASDDARRRLAEAGATVVMTEATDDIQLDDVLRHLVASHGATTVMLEAGPNLLGRCLHAGVINEAWVYIAPKLMADPDAKPAIEGHPLERLANIPTMSLVHTKRLGDDVLVRYRRMMSA